MKLIKVIKLIVLKLVLITCILLVSLLWCYYIMNAIVSGSKLSLSFSVITFVLFSIFCIDLLTDHSIASKFSQSIIVFWVINKNKKDETILLNFAEINEDISLIYYDRKWNIVRKNIMSNEKILFMLLNENSIIIHNEANFVRPNNINILFDKNSHDININPFLDCCMFVNNSARKSDIYSELENNPDIINKELYKPSRDKLYLNDLDLSFFKRNANDKET